VSFWRTLGALLGSAGKSFVFRRVAQHRLPGLIVPYFLRERAHGFCALAPVAWIIDERCAQAAFSP
jgi:hypothetical protein